MPASRRAPALAALLAAVLVTPSACNGGGGDNRTTGATTEKRGATANDIDINPVPRNELPDGGTLRWPIVALPPNFNTGELDGTSADAANVVGALLPSMFGFDSEARPTVNKDYLDSAELTAKDPRQVVTYRINRRAVVGRRHADNRSRLRSAVEGAVGIQPGVPGRLVEWLRADRERRRRRRRP